jgi:hypothetical protein
VERGAASRWDTAKDGKRPEEMDEEEKFRMKRKAAGALLKDLDAQLAGLEQNIDRSKGRGGRETSRL